MGLHKTNVTSVTRRQEFIKHVYNDICNGALYSNLMDKLMNDGYGLNFKYAENSAKDIITDARNLIKKDFEESRPQMREQLLAQLYDIYNEARESKDRNAALTALKQISKLTGADEVEKWRVDCDIFGNIQIEFGFDKQ